MPLYEYQCDVCGHRFEKIQKFSDPRETTCPKCGGVIHKLMSSPAIQFKGSGFYITDYAKKDYVSAAKADHEGSKSDGHSGKSETHAHGTPVTGDKGEKAEKGDKAGKPASSSDSSTSSTPAAAPAKTTSGD